MKDTCSLGNTSPDVVGVQVGGKGGPHREWDEEGAGRPAEGRGAKDGETRRCGQREGGDALLPQARVDHQPPAAEEGHRPQDEVGADAAHGPRRPRRHVQTRPHDTKDPVGRLQRNIARSEFRDRTTSAHQKGYYADGRPEDDGAYHVLPLPHIFEREGGEKKQHSLAVEPDTCG